MFSLISRFSVTVSMEETAAASKTHQGATMLSKDELASLQAQHVKARSSPCSKQSSGSKVLQRSKEEEA